jgi:hypothetical protein
MLKIMQTNVILAEIDREIAQLQHARALLAGDETAPSGGKLRGRPKGSFTKTKPAVKTAPKAGKRRMSAEGKARIAAAQKARWAAQKKANSPAKRTAKKSAAKPKAAKKQPVPTKKSVAAQASGAPDSTAAEA